MSARSSRRFVALVLLLVVAGGALATMPSEVGVAGGTTGAAGVSLAHDTQTFALTAGASYFWVAGFHSRTGGCASAGVSFYDNTQDPGFTGSGDIHWSFDNATAWGNPLTVNSISVIASGSISAGGGWAVVQFTMASGMHAMSDMGVQQQLAGACTTLLGEIGWAKDGATCPNTGAGCAYSGQLFSFSNTESSPSRVFSYITTGPSPPAAPVLSGSVVAGGPGGWTSVLTWTTPSGTISGYNLTRIDEWGSSTTYNLGLVNTYSEPATSGNRTWSVVAWGSAGTGATSNNVTLRIPPVPFFGDSGAIYGGSKTTAAAAWSIPTAAIDPFYGLILVLFFAAAGFAFFSAPGALGGLVGGFLIAVGTGLFNLWVTTFVVVVGVAGLVAWMKYGRGPGA